ncbi:MAG: hypothetical protein KI790_10120 [Cyclobacteriaceae bacterium]|nr:hypothetical protein [Cyclobacteriaceae bacterium HetDA_MAG_MS6]
MNTFSTKSDADQMLVKSRFGPDLYHIKKADYYRIMDMIWFFHESIYDLPDHELIVGRKYNQDKNEDQEAHMLKVNEIVFL